MTINVGDYVLYHGKVWKIVGSGSFYVLTGWNCGATVSTITPSEITKVASGTNRLEDYEYTPQYVWASSAFDYSWSNNLEPVYIDDSAIDAVTLHAQDILATHLVDLRSGD